MQFHGKTIIVFFVPGAWHDFDILTTVFESLATYRFNCIPFFFF